MPKLTKRSVEAMQPETKDCFVWDDDIKGFGVRVMASGARTYQAQYRKGGRTRRISLGRHGNITKEQARLKAREVMGLVAKGENPAEDIAQHRRAPRVAALCERFFAAHVMETCKPTTQAAYRRAIDKFITPAIGAFRVVDVPPKTKVEEIAGVDEAATIASGLRVTGLRSGAVGNRQIAIYDKRAEVIQSNKLGWLTIWNAARKDSGHAPIDLTDRDTSQVWSFEMRLGSKQLRNKFELRNWDDIRSTIGDAFTDATSWRRRRAPISRAAVAAWCHKRRKVDRNWRTVASLRRRFFSNQYVGVEKVGYKTHPLLHQTCVTAFARPRFLMSCEIGLWLVCKPAALDKRAERRIRSARPGCRRCAALRRLQSRLPRLAGAPRRP